jgi:glycosyltransferase involved in cell wall biosynthesis
MIVVVSWVHHHARSEGLAEALGADAVFMPWARPAQRWPRRIASWLRSGARTARLVRSLPEGSTIVVSAPPVFAPLVVRSARRSADAFVVDLHSGALNDAHWRWSFPTMRHLLRHADLVLVTNREIVGGVGLRDEQVAIVHDLLVVDAPPPEVPTVGLPVVVFPASGAADEPIDVVVEAARLLREVARIVVTGRRGEQLPEVEQVGFLPVPEYRGLLSRAAAVLTLTTRDATMQQAAYEALHLGRPIVCSDTAVLRDVLGDAAVVVEHTGESIAAGIREALRRAPELEAAATEMDQRLRRQSEAGLAAVRSLARRRRGVERG